MPGESPGLFTPCQPPALSFVCLCCTDILGFSAFGVDARRIAGPFSQGEAKGAAIAPGDYDFDTSKATALCNNKQHKGAFSAVVKASLVHEPKAGELALDATKLALSAAHYKGGEPQWRPQGQAAEDDASSESSQEAVQSSLGVPSSQSSQEAVQSSLGVLKSSQGPAFDNLHRSLVAVTKAIIHDEQIVVAIKNLADGTNQVLACCFQPSSLRAAGPPFRRGSLFVARMFDGAPALVAPGDSPGRRVCHATFRGARRIAEPTYALRIAGPSGLMPGESPGLSARPATHPACCWCKVQAAAQIAERAISIQLRCLGAHLQVTGKLPTNDHLRRLARGVKEAEESGRLAEKTVAGNKELAGLASLGNGAWSATGNDTRARKQTKYDDGSSGSAPSGAGKSRKKSKKSKKKKAPVNSVAQVGSPSPCRGPGHRFSARSLSRSFASDLALCHR